MGTNKHTHPGAAPTTAPAFLPVLAVLLILAAAAIGWPAFAYATDDGLADSYEGKTVILQSNDVHGAVDGYRYMAGLRDELKSRGADVFLVDSGDFLQGNVYVSYCKGRSAITLMNAAEYDVITIGNHDFDYCWPQLEEYLADLKPEVICDSILDGSGASIVKKTTYIENDGVKIGFFGVDTPETKTKTSPEHVAGLEFLDDATHPKIFDQAAEDIKGLKQNGADIVLGLTHLGVDPGSAPYRSVDLWDAVKGDGADLLLDGHSHTVMTGFKDGQPIVTYDPDADPILSTGTQFANIGMVVIDEASKKIDGWQLYQITDTSYSNAEVKAVSDHIIAEVEERYGQKAGTSLVDLNGFRDAAAAKAAGSSEPNGNRDGETNLGDMMTDAYRWYALKNESSLDVPADHVVGHTNGGALRAGIPKGDFTRMAVLSVIPFDNQVQGLYVTGKQLLEALEASTQDTPTPDAGFPQMSGIEYKIDTRYAYYPRSKTYPNSEYYGPKYIRRVTIKSINGKPFSPADTYLLITNSFVADGGDTYSALAGAKRIDTGGIDEQVAENYITEVLGGTVDTQYEKSAGRIEIVTGDPLRAPNPMTVKAVTKAVKVKKLKKSSLKLTSLKVKNAEGKVTYKKVSGSPQLRLNAKTGKVTVKKGTKKGTYKIRIRTTAAGNKYCKKKTVTRTARVRVR